MSCVQMFAVPAVPVPDERSWQSHTLLESAEFDVILFPDVPESKKIPSFRLCRIVLPWTFTDSGAVLVTSMPSFTAYRMVLSAISMPTGPVVSSARPLRTATPENGECRIVLRRMWTPSASPSTRTADPWFALSEATVSFVWLLEIVTSWLRPKSRTNEALFTAEFDRTVMFELTVGETFVNSTAEFMLRRNVFWLMSTSCVP